MTENKSLPAFDSTEELVEFFDSTDMGDFDLPEAEFEVDMKDKTISLENGNHHEPAHGPLPMREEVKP